MAAQNGSSLASAAAGIDARRPRSSGPNIIPSDAPPTVRRKSRLFIIVSLPGECAGVHVLHELDEPAEIRRAVVVHRHVPSVGTEQVAPLGTMLRHPLDR